MTSNKTFKSKLWNITNIVKADDEVTKAISPLEKFDKVLRPLSDNEEYNKSDSEYDEDADECDDGFINYEDIDDHEFLNNLVSQYKSEKTVETRVNYKEHLGKF